MRHDISFIWQGWHCVDSGISIDLSAENMLNLFELAAPYMVRVLSILKHSNIDLQVVKSPEGERLHKVMQNVSWLDHKRLLSTISSF